MTETHRPLSTTSQHSSLVPTVSTTYSTAHSSTHVQPFDETKVQRTADAKRAFLSTFQEAAKDIDAGMQWRATAIHEQAEELMQQEQELDQKAKQIERDNEEAEGWLRDGAKKLEEFDDLEALEAGLKDDLEDLEIMLSLMEQKQKDGKYDEQEDDERHDDA